MIQISQIWYEASKIPFFVCVTGMRFFLERGLCFFLFWGSRGIFAYYGDQFVGWVAVTAFALCSQWQVLVPGMPWFGFGVLDG